jgi:hypothetical protein
LFFVHCPILKKLEDKVFETGSFSSSGKWGDTYSFVSLRKNLPSQLRMETNQFPEPCSPVFRLTDNGQSPKTPLILKGECITGTCMDFLLQIVW